MPVYQLPPSTITQGKPFDQEYLWEEGGVPVDLTGWEGEFVIATEPFDSVIFRGEVDFVGGGLLRTTIGREDTEAMPSLLRMRGGPNAYLQVRLTDPDGIRDQVWQGHVTIEGVWK